MYLLVSGEKFRHLPKCLYVGVFHVMIKSKGLDTA